MSLVQERVQPSLHAGVLGGENLNGFSGSVLRRERQGVLPRRADGVLRQFGLLGDIGDVNPAVGVRPSAILVEAWV